MRRAVLVFVRNNEVPHIATYETHQRVQEISFVTRKRLLQQFPLKSGRRQAAPDPITGRMKHTTCPKLLQSHNRPALVRRLTLTDDDHMLRQLQRGIYYLVLMPSLGSRSGRCNSRCGPVRRVPVLNPAPVAIFGKSAGKIAARIAVQCVAATDRNFAAALRRLSAINRTITLTYRFLPLRADVGSHSVVLGRLALRRTDR